MRKLGTGIFTLSLALALIAGCERHSNSEHYYLVATNIDLPYWQAAAAGLKQAASEYGVQANLRGPGYFDPQGEAQTFDEVLALKPSGILVSVADPGIMGPEIDKALAAGVPVITIDSDAPNSKRLYFIGTNNVQAGRLGGERVAAKLNGKGNVVFFTDPGQPNLEDRLTGYKNVFSKFPGIKIVEVFDMKGDPGTAMDKAREYLARKGADKIDAFVCLEASAGKDVAEAFKRDNAQGRELMAMDIDKATLDLVKSGTIDATISQKPFTMGLLGLKGLDDIHHYPVKPLTKDYSLDARSPFPAFVDTGVTLVDRTNVDKMLAAYAPSKSQ